MSSKKDPESGHPGHLNESQQKTLDEFKTYLKSKGLEFPGDPPICDDVALLRFLRSRQFNLEKTKQAFEKYLQFRKDFRLTELRSEFDFPEREDVIRIWPQYFHKKGRPIYVQHCGVDPKALYAATTPTKLTQAFTITVDHALTVIHPACTKAIREKESTDRAIDNSLVIMNMKNVSISTFWSLREPLKNIIDYSQQYFPEATGPIFVINAPTVFTAIWTIVRPWLDEATASKVTILGTNYLPNLLEHVDLENIPRPLGGECKDCEDCTLSNEGPWKSMGGLPWNRKEVNGFNELTGINGANGGVKDKETARPDEKVVKEEGEGKTKSTE